MLEMGISNTDGAQACWLQVKTVSLRRWSPGLVHARSVLCHSLHKWGASLAQRGAAEGEGCKATFPVPQEYSFSLLPVGHGCGVTHRERKLTLPGVLRLGRAMKMTQIS